MTYLLDTCILSKLRKIRSYPDPRLESWVSKHSQSQFYISVISIGEIHSGINKINVNHPEEKRKKRVLEDWLFGALIPQFQSRILNFDVHVALAWGKIIENSKKSGNFLPIVDAYIAATAIVHQLIVVTENIRDFENSGAMCFNPCD